MTNIELPTYRTIVANKIFGRKSDEVLYEALSNQPEKTTQIARLTRFVVPTQGQVIDFIRAQAQALDLDSLIESDDDPRKSYFLKMLPEDKIRDITKGDKKTINHLKEHYEKGSLTEGSTYISALNGLIPNSLLEKVKQETGEKVFAIYEKAIRHVGMHDWEMRVRLQENGTFPDILELEYLLSRGVRDCEVFKVRGKFKDYNQVATQMRMLSNVFSSPEMIVKIGDTSYQVMEQKAAETMRNVVACVQEKKVMGQGIMGIIGPIVFGGNSGHSMASGLNQFGKMLMGTMLQHENGFDIPSADEISLN